jgi:hypothetical protein
METKEYIESGILELYVYGPLRSPKMKSSTKSKESLEINSEIVAMKKSIVSLSSSFRRSIGSQL